MEVKEIEELIKACPINIEYIGEKADTINIIDKIVGIRKYNSRFNFNRFNYDCEHEGDTLEVYTKLQKGTLEGQISEIGVTLLTIANRYHLDMRSLHIDSTLSKAKDLETLMLSMIKIALSEYNMAKKIVILVGMLMCYCLRENIDVLFFIRKRLLLNEN